MKYLKTYESYLFESPLIRDILGLEKITVDEDYFITGFTMIINNKPMNIEISWNHSKEHNLHKKLEARTRITVSELNYLTEHGFKYLLKNNYDILEKNKTYTVYFKEYKFSLITKINFIYEYKMKIFIKTIINRLDNKDVKDVFILDTTII